MSNENITLGQAQKQVDEWIKTVGVRYFSELTNMAILSEEVGELARHFARQFGDQAYRDAKTAPPTEEAKKALLADEMADVLWVLICLANQTGVDLNDAFLKNMEKKNKRDNERHQNNKKLRSPQTPR